MANVDDLIGIPFVDEGRSPAGYDCWGLAMEVASRFAHVLPEFYICAKDTLQINKVMNNNKTLADQNENPKWKHLTKPDPGCLILLTNTICGVNHAGIYLGQDKFIHTLRNIGVHIDKITGPMWKRRIKGFYWYVG